MSKWFLQCSVRRPAAVSMKESEYTSAKRRAENLGLTFSAYVNTLIRRDMRTGGGLLLHSAEDGCLKEEAVEYEVKKGRPKACPKTDSPTE
jgi:hypothetical protein